MKKFENVIIATDLDGTFLTSREHGNRRNREAITYFKQQGGHFTVSTGRNFRQVLKVVPDARELLNLPAVTCNGASLYDFEGERELAQYLIPEEDLLALAGYLDTQCAPIGIRAAAGKTFLFYGVNNVHIQKDYESFDPEERKILPVREWEAYPVYKLAVRADVGVLDRIRPILAERFVDRLEITRSASTLLDVQAKGRTKAALLREMINKEFDHPTYLCVAGDYDNDLEMLSIADLPVCPENAQASIRAICRKCFCHYRDGLMGDIVEYLDGQF